MSVPPAQRLVREQLAAVHEADEDATSTISNTVGRKRSSVLLNTSIHSAKPSTAARSRLSRRTMAAPRVPLRVGEEAEHASSVQYTMNGTLDPRRHFLADLDDEDELRAREALDEDRHLLRNLDESAGSQRGNAAINGTTRLFKPGRRPSSAGMKPSTHLGRDQAPRAIQHQHQGSAPAQPGGYSERFNKRRETQSGDRGVNGGLSRRVAETRAVHEQALPPSSSSSSFAATQGRQGKRRSSTLERMSRHHLGQDESDVQAALNNALERQQRLRKQRKSQSSQSPESSQAPSEDDEASLAVTLDHAVSKAESARNGRSRSPRNLKLSREGTSSAHRERQANNDFSSSVSLVVPASRKGQTSAAASGADDTDDMPATTVSSLFTDLHQDATGSSKRSNILGSAAAATGEGLGSDMVAGASSSRRSSSVGGLKPRVASSRRSSQISRSGRRTVLQEPEKEYRTIIAYEEDEGSEETQKLTKALSAAMERTTKARQAYLQQQAEQQAVRLARELSGVDSDLLTPDTLVRPRSSRRSPSQSRRTMTASAVGRRSATPRSRSQSPAGRLSPRPPSGRRSRKPSKNRVSRAHSPGRVSSARGRRGSFRHIEDVGDNCAEGDTSSEEDVDDTLPPELQVDMSMAHPDIRDMLTRKVDDVIAQERALRETLRRERLEAESRPSSSAYQTRASELNESDTQGAAVAVDDDNAGESEYQQWLEELAHVDVATARSSHQDQHQQQYRKEEGPGFISQGEPVPRPAAHFDEDEYSADDADEVELERSKAASSRIQAQEADAHTVADSPTTAQGGRRSGWSAEATAGDQPDIVADMMTEDVEDNEEVQPGEDYDVHATNPLNKGVLDDMSPMDHALLQLADDTEAYRRHFLCVRREMGETIFETLSDLADQGTTDAQSVRKALRGLVKKLARPVQIEKRHGISAQDVRAALQGKGHGENARSAQGRAMQQQSSAARPMEQDEGIRSEAARPLMSRVSHHKADVAQPLFSNDQPDHHTSVHHHHADVHAEPEATAPQHKRARWGGPGADRVAASDVLVPAKDHGILHNQVGHDWAGDGQSKDATHLFTDRRIESSQMEYASADAEGSDRGSWSAAQDASDMAESPPEQAAGMQFVFAGETGKLTNDPDQQAALEAKRERFLRARDKKRKLEMEIAKLRRMAEEQEREEKRKADLERIKKREQQKRFAKLKKAKENKKQPTTTALGASGAFVIKDDGTKMRSNKGIIRNALCSTACLGSGEINAEKRTRALQILEGCDTTHYIILLRDPNNLKYRGFYQVASDGSIRKLDGAGPKHLQKNMIAMHLRYDSGSKEFKPLPSKEISVCDAVALRSSCWPKPKSLV